jgi:hypothetical protein
MSEPVFNACKSQFQSLVKKFGKSISFSFLGKDSNRSPFLSEPFWEEWDRGSVKKLRWLMEKQSLIPVHSCTLRKLKSRTTLICSYSIYSAWIPTPNVNHFSAFPRRRVMSQMFKDFWTGSWRSLKHRYQCRFFRSMAVRLIISVMTIFSSGGSTMIIQRAKS